MKNPHNSTFDTSLDQQVNMIAHWLIRLTEYLDQAKEKELKEILRFTRWYYWGRLLELEKEAEEEGEQIPYDDFYRALYHSYDSEIKECQLALDDKDTIWDATGTPLPKDQIRDRMESLKPLRDYCARQLCEECQK
ncbi:hypothetical protein [Fodinibius sp. AD559]|uniref:hypothetical protein n=1 Tax=Fodinibius sp. AD559 TaxID=3424179 RepID=UPI004046EF4C